MRSRKRILLRASLSGWRGRRSRLNQAEAEQLRSDLTRHVIRRRSEAAGNQKDVATAESIEQRSANSRAIRNRRLSAIRRPSGKELLTEIGEVGVGDAAKQQFRAGIEDLDVHSQLRIGVASHPLGWRCDEASVPPENRSPFSRKSLDPGVDSRVLVEFLSQVVNVEKIREHPQQDLSRRRGLEMHGAQPQVLAGENFLAVCLR